MIALSYAVAEEEWVEAGTQLALKSRSFVVLAGLQSAIIALCGFVLIYLDWIGFGSVWVGLAVFSLVARWQGVRRGLRKSYRGAPFMRGEIELKADESGTTTKYATGSAVTTWEGYTSYFETSQMFGLLLSDTFIRVIPKRAFTQGQLTEFRDLLQRKLPTR